ncbi:MAG: hypothetical protein HRT90_08920 [Candidatus Margulisbacteria bacterium]|nr:hypothetical protein [Candidatus Margulisiibacteriota bacterium]
MFINDSKATNPASTRVAVESFKEDIHLILCGEDKGIDIREFIEYLHSHVQTITVFGGLTDRVIHESQTQNPDFNITSVSSVEEAVQTAFGHSKPQDIILFSPSGSSFDQFQNFEERGQCFKDCVDIIHGKNKSN